MVLPVNVAAEASSTPQDKAHLPASSGGGSGGTACQICMGGCSLIPNKAAAAICIATCQNTVCSGPSDEDKQIACNSDCVESCHAYGTWNTTINTCTCVGTYICAGSTTGPCCDPCYYNPCGGSSNGGGCGDGCGDGCGCGCGGGCGGGGGGPLLVKEESVDEAHKALGTKATQTKPAPVVSSH